MSPSGERQYIVKNGWLSPNIKESENLILDPHPDLDQNKKFITSGGSPLAHAYRVWSTSISMSVSYPADT